MTEYNKCVYILKEAKKKTGAVIFIYTARRNVKGNFTEREKNANDKNPYFDY